MTQSRGLGEGIVEALISIVLALRPVAREGLREAENARRKIIDVLAGQPTLVKLFPKEPGNAIAEMASGRFDADPGKLTLAIEIIIAFAIEATADERNRKNIPSTYALVRYVVLANDGAHSDDDIRRRLTQRADDDDIVVERLSSAKLKEGSAHDRIGLLSELRDLGLRQ
jgi:hypothetical protein